MKLFLRHMFTNAVLTIVVVVSVVGCAQIRKLTYPKDFTYLEKKEVDTLMRQMSNSVVRLDQLITDTVPSDSDRQPMIIGELNILENTATRLSGGGNETNFPELSEHIEKFISDIVDARMLASASPPNYTTAGKLTRSCQGCHKFR